MKGSFKGIWNHIYVLVEILSNTSFQDGIYSIWIDENKKKSYFKNKKSLLNLGEFSNHPSPPSRLFPPPC